ncbi:MAG: hypothetical protein WAK48_26955 [Candidatus Acidiferrum sp.]
MRNPAAHGSTSRPEQIAAAAARFIPPQRDYAWMVEANYASMMLFLIA